MSESQTLVLGGGCFLCTESVYKEVRGVTDVESGYSNGQAAQPSYEAVCTGRTGCNEVVKLVYDPAQISTRELLEIFFVIHDPTTPNRQGNDVGTQYRSGIYFTTEEQRDTAQTLLNNWRATAFLDARWSPSCCRWPTTGPPRTTTRTSLSATRTKATAWRWPRPRWPSSRKLSPGWCATEPLPHLPSPHQGNP
jgi:methionine-S-sulfoxide reductase